MASLLERAASQRGISFDDALNDAVRAGRRVESAQPVDETVAHHRGERGLRVLGVDGCKGGWAVVALLDGAYAHAFLSPRFADVVRDEAAVIAVDIPIGIPEAEGRRADSAARHFVAPRGSSVFPTPVRSALEATTYDGARAASLASIGKSLSKQAYMLAPKILEVDAIAAGDDRVIEVHPECSFREIVGRPLDSKHAASGRVDRRALLHRVGIDLPDRVVGIPELDLLDAAAAAWSADRYGRGAAIPLPDDHFERIGAIWR